jgi:collagen type VII alpha
MKKLWLIPLLLSFLGTAMAEQRLQGWCEVGGQKVVNQGVNSTTLVQVSYPNCTVTVYQTGTVTKATLHSDNSGTILANPFTANSNGSWGFYTADGRYDIVLSKTASTGFPFTISDVLFCDPTTCGGGGGGGSGTVTSVGVSASNTGLSVAGSPVTTSGTIALTSSAAAADEALRSTAANVSSYTAIPQCTDSAGNHLNYDTGTHTFSCGNSGSGGTGTVTSVGMTATNTGFSVSGVPITTSGTIALTAGATAADQALVSTDVAVTNFTPVPNCQDSAGQHLNYNTTTHLFSCGSSTPSAGIALSPCGVWTGATAYAQGCVVFYSGSSYAAQVANTGITPGSEGGVTWQVFAQAGSNGTNGTNGTNGATGAPGAPGYSPNQIISGCGVSYGGTGFTFTVQQCTFLVNNIQYTALQTSVTGTAADASLDRVDSIVANSCASLPCNGTITIVPGTASATPAPPSLDLNTQTQITFYQVGAGSTQPSNLATTDIYHNNTEWTCASTANFNCASTNNPHTGTLDIEATSATAGNNARLTIPSGTVNVGDYNTVNFFIRSKAAWAATRSLTIQLYNGSTAKCTPVTFRDGNFTFNSATLGSYQLMSIPTSVFGCDGIPVTQLRFTVAGTGTTIGFYLDDITLEGGLISPVGTLGEVWKGNWSISTAYSVNNEVFYPITGSSYVALQANTGVTPGSNSSIWQVKDTHGPAGVDGNVQIKSGASFSAVNTSVSGSDVTWPGKLLASSFESTNTTDNTNWQFLTGSGGDSTCDTYLPAATNATLCIKSGIVTEAKNGGVTYYPLATTTGSTTTNNCAKFDANGNLVDAGAACGSGSGSVTSIATTPPITGGTITGTGTIACATCTTNAAAATANQLIIGGGSQAVAALGSLGTTTTVLHGNAGGAPTFGAIAPADTNSTLNVYGIGGVFGSDNGSALVTADIQPQASVGQFIVAGTLTTIIVKGDAGVSTIKFGYRHSAATTSYTSAVLTLAVVGGITDTVACANVAGTAITIDGVSVTCSTLATQTMTLGDSIITNGGAADGTTKRIAWTFVYTR